MKDFNLIDLFCEILSGILGILVTLLILDSFGYVEIEEIFKKITIDISFLTILIVASYFIGLFIDAIGLAFGEWFLDELIATEDYPDNSAMKIFNSKSSEHIAAYRYRQWKYYSLYRNLLILIVIGLPFYIIKMCDVLNWRIAVTSSILIIFLLVSILKSMRTLIDLYYKIAKNIE
jgi:hypothetical protein